jgi:hypothetical protein
LSAEIPLHTSRLVYGFTPYAQGKIRGSPRVAEAPMRGGVKLTLGLVATFGLLVAARWLGVGVALHGLLE